MPYFPPSGGGSTPGLPAVIAVDADGSTLMAKATGLDNTLRTVFNNTSGNTFFAPDGSVLIAATANSGNNTPSAFFSNQGGGTSWSIDVDGSFLGGGTASSGWDGDDNFYLNGVITSDGNGNFFMPSLPTSDPHSAGELWSNLGIITLSAG